MKCICTLLVALLHAIPLLAQGDTTAALRSDSLKVTYGGFVDAYYAYDFNRPDAKDRAYTTQPARHNEVNINLAFFEAKVTGDRVRGRLALQAGTSVQVNYSGEPTVGLISGPVLSRMIQEAVAGVRIADGLWIDGGIYFSHIGFESFISRDNWTYSRSLMSDYSPYYQSGIKLSYQFSPSFSAQLHALNGWQNISETNTDWSGGVQLAYTPSPDLSLTYNNYFGNDALDSMPARMRFFNDLIARVSLTNSFQVAGIVDVGIQARPSDGTSMWYCVTALGRLQLGAKVAVVGRVEYYADKDQVIVSTGTPNGFQTLGASLGVDFVPAPNVLWRVEMRGFSSRDAIYPFEAGFLKNDAFAVASFGLSF